MVDATPNTPSSNQSSAPLRGIKPATPDLILFDEESMPIETMTDLIFEDIGGREIINIARNDMLNGVEFLYQPIKNITSLYLQYNPQNILALQKIADSYFRNFPIRLANKIPENGKGTGPNGEIVYLDPNTGDIVVNVINMEPEEQVEIQILSAGSILNDTIYEVNEE